MKLSLLPSEEGDCIFIESGGVAILADGGMQASYESEVRKFLGDWSASGKSLDLVYVSHVDQDHIAGVLRLLEDLVLWRVHDHKISTGKTPKPPAFPRPPAPRRIWHNAFKAMVPNTGEIATMLASRANSLTSAGIPGALRLAAAYRSIANSIPEAVKVSRRIASDQLDIPLNGEFDGLLAMVRDTSAIRLRPNSALRIRVIGPFEEDLEILRNYWDKWFKAKANETSAAGLMDWLERNEDPLPTALGLSIDDELGRRSKVTEPNLASLMLLLEEGDDHPITAIMTGDGHCDDVLSGLIHHGRMADDGGIHVDVLKIPHHGSEHNLNRDFVKRVTADHYLLTGVSGRHENPDPRVVQVLCESRLGDDDQLSFNDEVHNPFTVWVNSSTAYLKRKRARIKATKGKAGLSKVEEDLPQMKLVEDTLNRFANAHPGQMTVRYLDQGPLVLDL